MGKKRDAYMKAEKAEEGSVKRLSEAKQSGDAAAIQQAATDLNQNHAIANMVWAEYKQDPKG